MKHAALFVSLLFASSVQAQTPQAPVVSPDVRPDRTVTLRLLAPNAREVVANGELDGAPHPLTKGADGVWSVTVGPLAPDIYTYAFTVDGVSVLDPQNTNTKLGYGFFGPVSVVEVPGDGPQFYDARPVPHGEVRILPYESKTMGIGRTLWVYTPPGYDKGANFPVLYLLHGAGDVESGWVLIGRANLILDNLVADGKAKPMVVVMPLGHPIESFWTGPSKRVPDALSQLPPTASLDDFITAMMAGDGAGGLSPVTRDLVEDVLPIVERRYKVSRRADDRAIAGLSMGGGQSANIAFVRSDLFRYVALMSPAVNASVEKTYAKQLAGAAALNRQFKLFWVGVGRDDTLTGPGDKAFHDALTRAGVTHTWALTDGRHEWTVWRHQLRDIVPLLFK